MSRTGALSFWSDIVSLWLRVNQTELETITALIICVSEYSSTLFRIATFRTSRKTEVLRIPEGGEGFIDRGAIKVRSNDPRTDLQLVSW